MRAVALASLVCLLAAPGRAGDVANTLRSRLVSVRLEDATLDGFVEFLRKATGVNIFVNRKAIAKDGGDADAIRVTIDVKDVPALDALRIVLEPLDLGMKVRGNVLLITSKRDARGAPVLVMYDVADVLMPIRDFPAPDINIHPSGYEPPAPPEPEEHRAVDSSEELAELVRQFTGRGTWEDEGIRITVLRRHLLVRQYPAVHAEIRRLLEAVRGLR
jgi:hypothetical protein